MFEHTYWQWQKCEDPISLSHTKNDLLFVFGADVFQYKTSKLFSEQSHNLWVLTSII